MRTFFRDLPESLWRATVVLATLAFIVQVAIAIGRSGAVAFTWLLIELLVTVALLALPIGIAWRGRQANSIWYTGGGLALLAVLWRIFFF